MAMTKEKRARLSTIMNDLIEHFGTQGATGAKLGISQQAVFQAKQYGGGSEEILINAEAQWSELGLGPSRALLRAAQFARENGISEEIIAKVAAWKWSPKDSAHKIYMQMHAEAERQELHPEEE